MYDLNLEIIIEIKIMDGFVYATFVYLSFVRLLLYNKHLIDV